MFVTRAGKCYSGYHNWVYWCSCDVRRAELIDSISSRVDTTFEEAATQLPECLHITVIRKIAEEDIDGVYGISPQHDFEGQQNGQYKYSTVFRMHYPTKYQTLVTNLCCEPKDINCIYIITDHSYAAKGPKFPSDEVRH